MTMIGTKMTTMSKWFMWGIKMSSSDLVTLAQMDGEMQVAGGLRQFDIWKKNIDFPLNAAIVYMIALPRMGGYVDYGGYGDSEHRLRFLLPIILLMMIFSLRMCLYHPEKEHWKNCKMSLGNTTLSNVSWRIGKAAKSLWNILFLKMITYRQSDGETRATENFLRWNIAVRIQHHTFKFWLLFIASRRTKRFCGCCAKYCQADESCL